MTLQEHQERYRSDFVNATLEDLIRILNREVGNTGWVSIRGAYHKALGEEILSRGVDGGDIITENSSQLSHPVKLKLVRSDE